MATNDERGDMPKTMLEATRMQQALRGIDDSLVQAQIDALWCGVWAVQAGLMDILTIWGL